jgi:hypothetical protein
LCVLNCSFSAAPRLLPSPATDPEDLLDVGGADLQVRRPRVVIGEGAGLVPLPDLEEIPPRVSVLRDRNVAAVAVLKEAAPGRRAFGPRAVLDPAALPLEVLDPVEGLRLQALFDHEQVAHRELPGQVRKRLVSVERVAQHQQRQLRVLAPKARQ